LEKLNSPLEFKEQIKKLISEKNWDATTNISKRAVEAFPKKLNFKKYLIKSLDCQGKYDEALIWAEKAAIQEIKRLKARKNPLENFKKSLKRHQRIMIAGYFYSGSGAISDYLKGFAKTKKWTPYGEMRLIKTPGGIWDYKEKFFKKDSKEAILNLYLTIVGIKETRSTIWNKSNRSSRKILSDLNNAEYVIALLKFWLNEKNMPSKDEISFYQRSSRALKKAYNKTCQIYDADRIVVDQSVNAFRLNLSKVLPPSTFIVVDRDPRDQFLEARLGWAKLGKKKWQSVEEFVSEYKIIRSQSYEWAASLSKEYGHKFYFYKFEEFVYNHKEISNRLKLDLKLNGDSKSYDPELSKINIHKYKDQLTTWETFVIEEELKEFLY
jgi:hypothetical protein